MISTALRRCGITFNPLSYGINWHAAYWTDDPAQTTPSDGARVAAWRDMSGNGRDLAQGTTAKQPAFMAQDVGLNRRPVIRGTNNTRLATSAFTGLTQPVSAVLVGSIYTNLWSTTDTGAVAIDSLPGSQFLLYSNTASAGAPIGKITFNTGSSIIDGRDARPYVWTAVGGTAAKVLKNGVSVVTGNAGTNTITYWSLGGLNFTGYADYSNWGSWAFVGFFAGDVTGQSGWSQFHQDLLTYYDLSGAKKLVLTDGDSRFTPYKSSVPVAYNPAADDWPSQLTRSLLSSVYTVNCGVPGQTQQTQTSLGAAKVDPNYSAGNTDNIVVTGGGINDCSTRTAAQIEGDIQTYCQDRRAAGWKVVVCTITPATTVTGASETVRTDVNAWIVANWSSWADAMVDLAADARLDDATDTTYFESDGVHYTRAGHSVVRELVAAQLATLSVT